MPASGRKARPTLTSGKKARPTLASGWSMTASTPDSMHDVLDAEPFVDAMCPKVEIGTPPVATDPRSVVVNFRNRPAQSEGRAPRVAPLRPPIGCTPVRAR